MTEVVPQNMPLFLILDCESNTALKTMRENIKVHTLSTMLALGSRYWFFTGKGGVGKTTVACATAIALADQGRRVLLVSTDPASNLDEMLGVALSNKPVEVPGVNGLYALNINPEQAAHEYRERVLSPLYGERPEQEIQTIREQLSGACTTEIAAFDEFAGLLSGSDLQQSFDHVIFDTAPTGHTLRLLELPSAWTTFLETNQHGASCLGPHSGLKTRQERFSAAMRVLRDAEQTTVVLVTRPAKSALEEASRTSLELQALELRHQVLVVNGVFHAQSENDPVATAVEQRGERAMSHLPETVRMLPRYDVPLFSYNMVGIGALRSLYSNKVDNFGDQTVTASTISLPRLSSLVDEIAQCSHALVMVMGKGGVGKTTIAAALAVELAARGISVHLSTTDPAAHLESTIGSDVPNLQVSRIDPRAETKAYTQKIIERKSKNMDAQAKALLEEDLKSPCTEEVAVFHAFSQIVATARQRIVILDTAPTGHTLLLLDATGAYHRDILRSMTNTGARNVVTPLMRLQDPEYTKVLLVTLAETTPVSEAAQLQQDLRRAKIEPFAWVINNSLAATNTTDPLLRQRIQAELTQIDRVQTQYAKRIAVVPWATDEPVGPERLRSLVNK